MDLKAWKSQRSVWKRTKVDFPPPLRPTRASTSPFLMERLIPFKTSWSGRIWYVKWTFSSSMSPWILGIWKSKGNAQSVEWGDGYSDTSCRVNVRKTVQKSHYTLRCTTGTGKLSDQIRKTIVSVINHSPDNEWEKANVLTYQYNWNVIKLPTLSRDEWSIATVPPYHKRSTEIPKSTAGKWTAHEWKHNVL